MLLLPLLLLLLLRRRLIPHCIRTHQRGQGGLDAAWVQTKSTACSLLLLQLPFPHEGAAACAPAGEASCAPTLSSATDM